MNTEKVIKRDQKYIMHTYARSPLVLEHGEGMYAYDADGKAYLDFTSGIGVNALGYCHPAWVQAVTILPTCITPPPAASWPSGCAPAPGLTRCFSATLVPKPTRVPSSAPANTV
mgnify:CR=1 FL=1